MNTPFKCLTQLDHPLIIAIRRVFHLQTLGLEFDRQNWLVNCSVLEDEVKAFRRLDLVPEDAGVPVLVLQLFGLVFHKALEHLLLVAVPGGREDPHVHQRRLFAVVALQDKAVLLARREVQLFLEVVFEDVLIFEFQNCFEVFVLVFFIYNTN